MPARARPRLSVCLCLATMTFGCGGGSGTAPPDDVGTDLGDTGTDAHPPGDTGTDSAADTATDTASTSETGVDSSTDATSSSDAGGQIPGHGSIFTGPAFFYDDVSTAPVRTDSAAITALMVDYTTNTAGTGPHGFGTNTSEMRIDWSIVVNVATATTPKVTFQTVAGYYYTPDCDHAPMPLPPNGAVEQTYGVPPDFSTALSGYGCAGFAGGGDCHLIVVAPLENRLYEIYHSTVQADGTLLGGCQAIFPTDVALTSAGRGAHCSSADAGGFPIAPMLFSADDVYAGHIDHAIRFIVPNELIVNRTYVAPATHATNSGGPAGALPYGARLRLRADYPVTSLSAGAQVIARALQRYGMIIADGGQVALTAESDLFTAHTWAEVGITSTSLAGLNATDFEVLEAGPTVYDDWNCQRTPLTQ